MSFWGRLTGRDDGAAGQALYDRVVARGRDPDWYLAGGVPDTIDGRFDMIAAVLALVLIRLERDPTAAAATARLTECFVADMDGQLRQIGIGDVVVGKHVGKMMGMLGGRLGAYRDGLAAGDLKPALVRNLYRGEPPGPAALEHVVARLTAFDRLLAGAATESLVAGALP